MTDMENGGGVMQKGSGTREASKEGEELRNHGEVIMEDESWRRNHGGRITAKSWRRNQDCIWLRFLQMAPDASR
jgi:hypothetical protein